MFFGGRIVLGIVAVIAICFCGARNASAETLPLAKYPDEEKKLANTVDPWGLGFADQMERFQSHFHGSRGAFVAGDTHTLVKVWPNKYWFRGETIPVAAAPRNREPLWAVTGSTASFQVAVLPKTGAAKGTYSIDVTSTVPVTINRQVFIKLGPAAYPRFESTRWPDPLVPEKTAEVSGTDLAVFLCEAEIPRDFKAANLTCNVSVKNGAGESAQFVVPIEVVPLDIKPKELPLTALFLQGKLTEQQYKALSAMTLAHHLQPLSGDQLKTYWKPDSTAAFDQRIAELQWLGQNTFQLWNPPDPKVYAHLKAKGWLSQFIIQSNTDEPLEDAFNQNCIPYAKKHREQFPGLRLFLATECHPRIAEGCDIVWTDLSTSKYDPRIFKVPAGLEVWQYYCHMPIGCQLRAPIYRAPNMEVDNTALEHRVALWMSNYYKANGIFIWAGNFEWSNLGADFWKSPDFSGDAYRNAATYPYGGVHHGNGFLVYPPRTEGSPVLPSLRLKVLRDGMEDIAILNAIQKKYGKDAEAWITPVPEVFQHPQYFDALPETLLNKRTAILKKLRELTNNGR